MSHLLANLRLPPVADAASRLEQCVRVLIDDFGAQEIWVYGSVAKGEAGPDSDVDLLVVGGEDSPSENNRHRVARLLAHVQGTLPLGLNVVTPTQWTTLRQERSTIYPEIAEKGVRLYARDAN
jgi:predicted nucleotidyltransferase